ncbi:uncharacterized protein J4E78_002364 [Alternaria triticimaculans]|uniref:uncharacterized protein n=1 Tax=Alternaria triticimaculans TaxID=297637 RepID=UPI0020C30763|nr:uncharacterized protein J4E78_002364 [Alternaria triticimaculans]KAI4668537.1 hypothetical protein J4E78_002364 [Alternaria triticimaculans]
MLGEQVVIHEQEKRYLEARIHDGSQQQDKENKSTKASSEGQLGAARQEEEQKRYEQKISALKDQMSEEHWKWDAHLREVKDTYETRIKDLEVSFAERMKNEYEQHCEQTRQEMGKHQVTVNEYQSNVARLKLNAEQEGRLLHEDLQTQREKLREEQKRHEKNLKRQEAGLTKKHTQEILQLQTTLVEQRQELSHLRHVKANADEERLRMRDEVRAKTTQFSEEQQRLRELLEKQNAELVEKHALEITQLRLANEELKQAFIDKAYPQRTKARSVKVMRYRDISTQFFSVVSQVQDFTNLEWDMRREVEWPFSNDQLLRIHKVNTRVLKKAILQNTIIPAATEARRYEAARAVLDLMNPSSETTPDEKKLKASYEATVTSLLSAIHQVLSKIAVLEPKDAEALETLIRLCAKTWMELCSQPYRVMMILPPGSGDLLSSPHPDERPLKLVVSPELKRYGNMQGEDLMKGEVFTRCQAVVQQYPVEPTGS